MGDFNIEIITIIVKCILKCIGQNNNEHIRQIQILRYTSDQYTLFYQYMNHYNNKKM